MPTNSDGKSRITIFQLEGRVPASCSKPYALTWCPRSISPQDFGERNAKHNERWLDTCPLFYHYGANGECWQRMGIDGFLDEAMAYRAFDALVKHSTHDKKQLDQWRLVRCDVEVKVQILKEGDH